MAEASPLVFRQDVAEWWDVLGVCVEAAGYCNGVVTGSCDSVLNGMTDGGGELNNYLR